MKFQQWRHYLNDNWICKLPYSHISNEGMPGYNQLLKGIPAQVPGTIHLDLMRAGIIPDPFKDENEKKVQWVAEQDWCYLTSFDFPEVEDAGKSFYLIFEGIDTVADIYLNDYLLGRVQNMFRQHRFLINEQLRKTNNILRIHLFSPVRQAQKLRSVHGNLPASLDMNRIYLRKAQYSFGWDWGPRLTTSGIWRPVYIEKRDAVKINNINFTCTELTENSATVTLQIKTDRFNDELNSCRLHISILYGDRIIYENAFQSNEPVLSHSFHLKDIRLWFPRGMGTPHLYRLRVRAENENGQVYDSITRQIGFRKIELVTETEAGTPTFRFLINNRPLFMKGVNWIPGDNFLPRMKPEHYEKLLQKVTEANMNMVRVWGGGIYEDDLFYDLCDRLGILVWQDFMFACAAYPEYDAFIEEVENEVKEIVERLQIHPSIALWCGNNECEWGWHMTRKQPIQEMPGYKIFHELIPKILSDLDPTRPYWPTTPFGSDEDPNDERTGNRHQWELWTGWKSVREVISDHSHFVTEFGFQAPANAATWKRFLSPRHRRVQNPVFDFHNKQIEGPERLFRYLVAELPVSLRWEAFLYLAQLSQALSLKISIEHWRGVWPGTNGTLIWQLNDCWPVVSWALIDSSLLPKISYYQVRNSFAPVFTNLYRNGEDVALKIFNHAHEPMKGTWTYRVLIPHNGEEFYSFKQSIILETEGSSQISVEDLPEGDWIIVTSFFNSDGEMMHRNVYTARPWKYLQLNRPRWEIELTKDQPSAIKIIARSPLYFCDLYLPVHHFSDRGFVLLAGEEKILKFEGDSPEFPLNSIEVFTLNMFLK